MNQLFLKTVMGILIGILLNLYIALASMTMLTLLILPIQEHGYLSHFLDHLQVTLTEFYGFQ